MKTTGTHIKRERVEVEINELEIIDAIAAAWLKSLPNLDRSAEYINTKGFWEYWTSAPHGSGTTETFRAATEEEQKIVAAIRLIRRVTIDVRKKV